MYSKEYHIQYQTFSVDDFLSDDFFIRSIKLPNEASDAFWSCFLEKYPNKAKDFICAKNTLLLIVDDPSLMLSELEEDQLLERIMRANKADRPTLKHPLRLKLIAAAIGTVACLAIIFFLNNKFDKQSHIMSYVNNIEKGSFEDPNIKLILSDKKAIISDDSYPDISYEADGIKLADEEISKNEAGKYNQLIVPYGKQSKLILSDGTKMWVNAGTVVAYPVKFTGNIREIYISGEVFMDVMPDKERPFIVKTDKFDIQVLGTSFNISSYKNEVHNVVLVSGKVMVSLSEDNKNIDLKPNQMFQLDNNDTTIKNVDVKLYTSWIDGIYTFQNEEVSVIMKHISKYYGKSIQFDTNIKELKCSGKLRLTDNNLDEILDEISKMTSTRITKKDDSYWIH